MPTTTTTTQQETAKAAQAFADYVAMGPGRSLDSLADRYQSASKPIPTKRIATLKGWSVKHRWQSRIAEAISAETERKLYLASELDADTFLETSRKLNGTIRTADSASPELVVRIRESVRKPQAKSGVSVKVSVEVRHMAEQMAKELGMDAEQLIRDAEEIAEAAWNKGVAT